MSEQVHLLCAGVMPRPGPERAGGEDAAEGAPAGPRWRHQQRRGHGDRGQWACIWAAAHPASGWAPAPLCPELLGRVAARLSHKWLQTQAPRTVERYPLVSEAVLSPEAGREGPSASCFFRRHLVAPGSLPALPPSSLCPASPGRLLRDPCLRLQGPPGKSGRFHLRIPGCTEETLHVKVTLMDSQAGDLASFGGSSSNPPQRPSMHSWGAVPSLLC